MIEAQPLPHHLRNVAPERLRPNRGKRDHLGHSILMFLENRQLLERLASPAADPAKELVEPNHHGHIREVLAQVGEIAQGVHLSPSPRHYRVEPHFVGAFPQHRHCPAFLQIRAQRHETRTAVVNDHCRDPIRLHEHHHKLVKALRVHVVPVHQIEMLDAVRLEAGKRRTDGIRVDAQRLHPHALAMLGQQRGDQRLADASLALQDHFDLGHP